jgi:hypothetical protein
MHETRKSPLSTIIDNSQDKNWHWLHLLVIMKVLRIKVYARHVYVPRKSVIMPILRN